MNKELKEKIAVNAANEWCRCFKCDGRVNATGCVCEKDNLLTCRNWYNGYRTALLAIEDDRVLDSLWKPADGDELPEIDREVVVLIKYNAQRNIHDEEYPTYRVGFGHRPNLMGGMERTLTPMRSHTIPLNYMTREVGMHLILHIG